MPQTVKLIVVLPEMAAREGQARAARVAIRRARITNSEGRGARSRNDIVRATSFELFESFEFISYSLIPVNATPRTKAFWKIRNTTTNGSVRMVAAAMR